MSCRECQDQLSDYVDDLVEAGERTRIEQHLSDCSSCRALRDDLLQIVHFSRQLPSRTPMTSLWTRVQAGVEAERSRPWWRRLINAEITLRTPQLALTTMVLFIAMSSAWLAFKPENTATSFSSMDEIGRVRSMSVQATIQDIEQRIGRLESLIDLRRTSWSPEMRGMFERQMLYVDQSLAECRQGLASTPDDDVYEDLMLGAYREKVRLLEEFSDY